MSNLIKLEFKKFYIRKNVFATIICNICILGFLCLIYFTGRAENDMAFTDYDGLISFLTTFVNVTYLIFAGFLISKFIIEEYKSKTILQLFSYPISRKKIIISKICIIAGFTFIFTIISNIMLFWSFYLVQILTNTVLEDINMSIVFSHLISTFTSALGNSMIGLIPLYFGMRKKSVPITILSSFIVACILNSSSNGFTLSSIIVIPIIFCLIGIFIVYISIKDIDSKDITI